MRRLVTVIVVGLAGCAGEPEAAEARPEPIEAATPSQRIASWIAEAERLDGMRLAGGDGKAEAVERLSALCAEVRQAVWADREAMLGGLHAMASLPPDSAGARVLQVACAPSSTQDVMDDPVVLETCLSIARGDASPEARMLAASVFMSQARGADPGAARLPLGEAEALAAARDVARLPGAAVRAVLCRGLRHHATHRASVRAALAALLEDPKQPGAVRAAVLGTLGADDATLRRLAVEDVSPEVRQAAREPLTSDVPGLMEFVPGAVFGGAISIERFGTVAVGRTKLKDVQDRELPAPDPAVFAPALGNARDEVRAAGVVAMLSACERPDWDRVRTLLRTDPSALVRVAVADALGVVGGRAPLDAEAFELLAAPLGRDAEPAVQVAAAQGLFALAVWAGDETTLRHRAEAAREALLSAPGPVRKRLLRWLESDRESFGGLQDTAIFESVRAGLSR